MPYYSNNPRPLFVSWTGHDANNMELVISKWEHVCGSLRIYFALKCKATLAGNKRWEKKKQPFIIFPQISGGNEYGCPQAWGEGNSGADEVPKGCVWTVPELFWAGSLPECVCVGGLQWSMSESHVNRHTNKNVHEVTDEMKGVQVPSPLRHQVIEFEFVSMLHLALILTFQQDNEE